MTPEQRKSIDNGIWLCQTHAKLIDSDEAQYDRDVLTGWKTEAEAYARLEVTSGTSSRSERYIDFKRIEALMGPLLQEMREDLRQCPLKRELVAIPKGATYNGKGTEFGYKCDVHADLHGQLLILENEGLIQDITNKNVKRYKILEALATYLQEESGLD